MKHQTNPAISVARLRKALEVPLIASFEGTIYSNRFKSKLNTGFFIYHSGYRLKYGSIRDTPTDAQQKEVDKIIDYVNQKLGRS